ncbi:hypothetical protein N7495_000307 [Penicillium taxi]|uniref:uncharacterized protein n=1 Tax=Penicillium taxi TaxID=168475 RepID=UPI002545A2F5|nr:uncharacterized protein N7495_000307 [Penicillium taxi]KAJ5907625.1 hypothetical protein N7495_000307 [Penicillium taxi]
MSSKSKESKSSGGFHQDYIASLRYRNDLPPPNMPPKFLEIPHSGLERFITPEFGEDLAAYEEPNIDVDAEGGMPIDLVGIPGLHLGDESAIMAQEYQTNAADLIDPADLPLLMTLDQLRHPATKHLEVSFLRRVQHVSSKGQDWGGGAAPAKAKPKATRKGTKNPQLEDPKYIKKFVQKGFDLAYPKNKHLGEDTESQIRGLPVTKAENDAWATPIHPSNSRLKPVGFFPVVPDLSCFTDIGGFIQIKFDKAPAPALNGKRDKRMDIALLEPRAPSELACQEHASKAALHKSRPNTYPDPGALPFDYDLYLPEKPEYVERLRTSLDSNNPNREDESLYTHKNAEGNKCHRYDRVRRYVTSSQTVSTADIAHNDEKRGRDYAITFYESNNNDDKQTAAYLYPIVQKVRVKPDRVAAAPGIQDPHKLREDKKKAEGEWIHQINLVSCEPTQEEIRKRLVHRTEFIPEE